MTCILQKEVLVLNKSYTAIGTTSLARALALVMKDNSAIILDDDYNMHSWDDWINYEPNEDEPAISSVNKKFKLINIIRLLNYNEPARIFVPFSRINVMKRDNYCCQYCGVKITDKKNLTIDHIVPKCNLGKTNFDNCVCCCRSCNNNKGDKPLSDTGMKLLSKPCRPRLYELNLHTDNISWNVFLKKI